MNRLFTVYLNGQKLLEYDRQTRLPGKQRQFLDGMDKDMDEGIEINGEFIANPDTGQRASFVAMHLMAAIETETEGMIGAGCAWLVNRLPTLREIRASEQGEAITMELVYD